MGQGSSLPTAPAGPLALASTDGILSPRDPGLLTPLLALWAHDGPVYSQRLTLGNLWPVKSLPLPPQGPAGECLHCTWQNQPAGAGFQAILEGRWGLMSRTWEKGWKREMGEEQGGKYRRWERERWEGEVRCEAGWGRGRGRGEEGFLQVPLARVPGLLCPGMSTSGEEGGPVTGTPSPSPPLFDTPLPIQPAPPIPHSPRRATDSLSHPTGSAASICPQPGLRGRDRFHLHTDLRSSEAPAQLPQLWLADNQQESTRALPTGAGTGEVG